MSVMVEKAESYRCCNSCGSNEDVINITTLMSVGRTKQGTQIALCRQCTEEMVAYVKPYLKRRTDE